MLVCFPSPVTHRSSPLPPSPVRLAAHTSPLPSLCFTLASHASRSPPPPTPLRSCHCPFAASLIHRVTLFKTYNAPKYLVLLSVWRYYDRTTIQPSSSATFPLNTDFDCSLVLPPPFSTATTCIATATHYQHCTYPGTIPYTIPSMIYSAARVLTYRVSLA